MRIIYRFTVYEFMWSFMESMSLLRKSQVMQSQDQITLGQTADFSLPLSWFKLSMQWMRFFNISYAFWSVWPVFLKGRMHSRLKNKHIKIIGIQLSIDFEKFGAVFKNTLFDVIYDIWINFRLSTLGCIFNTYFQSNCAFHYVSLYFKCLVL